MKKACESVFGTLIFLYPFPLYHKGTDNYYE